MKRKMKNLGKQLVYIAVVVALALAYAYFTQDTAPTAPTVTLADIPAYAGEPFVLLNGGQPDFTPEELTVNSYETYGELDELGRCTVAEACVGRDLMPTEKRGEIGSVRPTGWHSVRYDFVDGGSLYNRCHLIGFQLTGENANDRNLITGTRYLNTQGMLPFENLIADYVQETDNHVLYRVTPIFDGDDLVASGVVMEAQSVEDGGEGVSFNVYAYNVQPGVEIDYATGESALAPMDDTQTGNDTAGETAYILNTGSLKFHLPDCSGAASISAGNRETYTGDRQTLIDRGYAPCGACKP